MIRKGTDSKYQRLIGYFFGFKTRKKGEILKGKEITAATGGH